MPLETHDTTMRYNDNHTHAQCKNQIGRGNRTCWNCLQHDLATSVTDAPKILRDFRKEVRNETVGDFEEAERRSAMIYKHKIVDYSSKGYYNIEEVETILNEQSEAGWELVTHFDSSLILRKSADTIEREEVREKNRGKRG